MKTTLTIILFLFAYVASAQDTTITITPYPCDSSVTTTIPQRIIHVRDSTVTVFDTSYTAYSVYKLFWLVDGSVTITIPIYDTIPAHDTTFICSGCATCYATDTVITPPASETIYGMFPVNGQSFTQRLALTKSLGNDAFRDNFEVGKSAWKVQQVHDEPLMDLMTYNAPPCCTLGYFPTGAELTRQLNSLDSILSAERDNLPELISFNNEEPNFGFWKGTASDYIAWMNAATAIAHAHGIPVSNGGLLQNVVYYIRYIYQQEGKTDSVNMINQRGNLWPGTPTYVQNFIDWYKVEIPALAASNIDYVNFHFYEPALENDINKTTTSGLIPIVVSFLASRTGKPVITTEFGTGNDTKSLLFDMADEIKNAGVRIMIYYAGEGHLANYHPDWWGEWISAQ